MERKNSVTVVTGEVEGYLRNPPGTSTGDLFRLFGILGVSTLHSSVKASDSRRKPMVFSLVEHGSSGIVICVQTKTVCDGL